MKQFKDLFQQGNQNLGNENNNLFKENNSDGYFTKEEVVNHLTNLSENGKERWQLNHLITFFDFLKTGRDIDRLPNHLIEDGKGSTWLKFKIGKLTRNIKIIHFGDMKRLIDDYVSGKLKITQSLEDIYNESIG